jgi:NADH-quinone oxidoreductase subunit N
VNAADLYGILPLAILAGSSLVVLFAAAFTRRLVVSFVISLAGLAAAMACAGIAATRVPFAVARLLSFDRFVLFGFVLILGGTFFAAISSWAALRGRIEEGGDFFFLLLLSSLGACILAASSAFASFFLGLELMSVSLYAMIGWRRESGIGTEAAIKYLVVAGASSAFLLFGMAVFYADTGTMDLARLAEGGPGQSLLAPVGLGMMLVGIGFKLAVVPFHMWTPDVYDGAPAPVTGFIATVSKGAMVVVLARAFAPALVGTGGVNGMVREGAGALSAAFPWVFAGIAGLSMFAGNILALRESNVKRVLAYSSIAHLGYILVAFLAGGAEALRAIAFYLVAYFATTLGAFAAIAELSGPDRDADSLEEYRGLAARRPWLAAAFTAMLLSLAGLPLTAGFVGKFIILRAGAGAELWILAVILAVNGTISIFYYLKIVSTMFRGFAEHAGGPAPVAQTTVARGPLLAAAALAALTLIVVALGVFPSPLLAFIGTLTTSGF